MKKKIIYLLVLLSLISSKAFAGANSKIELTDGSIINGKIVSYTNGVYAVDSQGAGTVIIKESMIKNIGFINAPDTQTVTAPENNNLLSPQAEALKNQIMSDPKMMDSIETLKDDPQVQEIINDPEIMNAIKAGDLNALSKNSKFMGLTKNPTIQKIKDNVSK
jgi:hypothetical protein